MRNRSRKPKAEDVNQIAARMVRHITEAAETPDLSDEDARKRAAAALGRRGGLKGGPARAAKMTKAERSRSASDAARARWKKEKHQP
jgi:hypothetical protein